MNAIRFLSLTALIGLLAGCGDGGRLGRVSGTVTVDGKPVTQGTIMFVPADGKAAIGAIGPDGRFTLTTYSDGDGALVGPHKVTILSTIVGGSSFAPASIDDEVAMANGAGGNRILVPGKVTWIVPERFSQISTSELTSTVKSGSQTIDFDVPSK